MLYAAVEGRAPFDRDGDPLASLNAALTDEPEPAVHAGPLLWPVISGLLRKDPAWRLGAGQAEWMLRRAAAAPADRGLAKGAPPASATAAGGCQP